MLPLPLEATKRRHRKRCWIWTGRRGSRTCGCTPGGHVGTTDFGSACAPRSEDSGMAGPKRPCRAVTARGRRGGTHAARRRCQYEGTEVKHPTDPLMVKAQRLQQASSRKREPVCSGGVLLSHTTTHSGNIQPVGSHHCSGPSCLRS